MSKRFKLENDNILVSTESPGGLYNAPQLRKLADVCEDQDVIVKATEDQRLALVVAESDIDEVTTELNEAGLEQRDYQSGLHQPVACIGKHCAQHDQDALGAALDLTEAFTEINTEAPLKIGINGCSLCCVPTHTLDISIIGDMGGYRMSLGGKTSQIPEMATFMAEGIPADKLVELVTKVVALYKEKAESEESLQDLMERIGSSMFIEALAPYSQDAASDEDPFGGLEEPTEEEADTSDSDTASEEGQDEGDELDLDDLPEATEEESTEEESAADELIEGDSSDEPGEPDLSSLSASAEEVDEMDEDLTIDNPAADGEGPDINPSELEAEDSSLSDEVPINSESQEEDLEAAASEPETEATPVAESDSDTEAITMATDEIVEEASPIVDEETELEVEEDTIEEDEIAIEDNDSDEFCEIEEETIESLDEEDSAEPEQEFDSIDESEESLLEEKLQESIDEQAVIESTTTDENSDARDEALELAEEQSNMDFNSYEDQMPAAPAKIPNNNAFSGFQGLSFRDGRMCLSFGSGAIVNINIAHLEQSGGRRQFQMEGQNIIVTLSPGGVNVDIDGVEAFVPQGSIAA